MLFHGLSNINPLFTPTATYIFVAVFISALLPLYLWMSLHCIYNHYIYRHFGGCYRFFTYSVYLNHLRKPLLLVAFL